MSKSVKDMLNELESNGLCNMSVGHDGWCKSYKGLRNTCVCIVDTKKEFAEDKYNMLLIQDENGIKEDNVKDAYGLMIIQKFAMPHII